VRAPIVEGEDAPAVVDDEDRTMATVHDELPLDLQLLRVPASANSLLGASMSIPPIVALGPLPVLRKIGILSRKGEKMRRGLGKARRETSCELQ